MASEVDICNMALSNLGDSASVSSISPPEGSVQAENCSIFYPQARDSLLEMHSWNFATKRVRPSAITESGEFADSTTWDYAYPLPADCLTVISVMDESMNDDYSDPTSTLNYIPRQYQIEISGDGSKIIRTDIENMELRYVACIKNTALYSHLFISALSWHLTALLAGPILKGETGRKAALDAEKTMNYFFEKAKGVDTRQREVKPKHQVGWINAR